MDGRDDGDDDKQHPKQDVTPSTHSEAATKVPTATDADDSNKVKAPAEPKKTDSPESVAKETLQRVKVTELVMVLLTAIIAFSSVTTCYVYRRQLDVMQDTLNEIKVGGEESHVLIHEASKQAIFTKTVAEQTTSQANQMKSLAEQTTSMASTANQQWGVMKQQTALMRDQLLDARKASKKSADAIERQLTIANTQAGSMKTLADATALQLERTDRPYLTVSVSAKGGFDLSISIANEGRSAARAVRIMPKTVTRSDLYGNREFDKEIDRLCETPEEKPFSVFGIFDGGMIQPSESFNLSWRSFPEPMYVVGHDPHAQGPGGWFAPVLIGCVAYKIPYSTRVHHTPFAFDIFRRPKIRDRIEDLWPTNATVFAVPPEEIVLVRSESVLSQHQPD